MNMKFGLCLAVSAVLLAISFIIEPAAYAEQGSRQKPAPGSNEEIMGDIGVYKGDGTALDEQMQEFKRGLRNAVRNRAEAILSYGRKKYKSLSDYLGSAWESIFVSPQPTPHVAASQAALNDRISLYNYRDDWEDSELVEFYKIIIYVGNEDWMDLSPRPSPSHRKPSSFEPVFPHASAPSSSSPSSSSSSSGPSVSTPSSVGVSQSTGSPSIVAPVSVTSTAATSVTVTATAVTPTAVTPTSVSPAPVTPTAVTPTPVTPTPIRPTPVTPTPVEPTDITPAPIVPTINKITPPSSTSSRLPVASAPEKKKDTVRSRAEYRAKKAIRMKAVRMKRIWSSRLVKVIKISPRPVSSRRQRPRDNPFADRGLRGGGSRSSGSSSR